MRYVNIKLNDEIYKHIATRLNKNFSRRYLTVNKIFDDLKRVYVRLAAVGRLTTVGRVAGRVG
jgi:hypothetical protein